MTEKHSPLPWQKLSGGVVASEGKQLFVGTNANAALIVRSVNGLHEAIAALEHARDKIESIMGAEDCGDNGLLTEIAVALTKLKG